MTQERLQSPVVSPTVYSVNKKRKKKKMFILRYKTIFKKEISNVKPKFHLIQNVS